MLVACTVQPWRILAFEIWQYFAKNPRKSPILKRDLRKIEPKKLEKIKNIKFAQEPHGLNGV